MQVVRRSALGRLAFCCLMRRGLLWRGRRRRLRLLLIVEVSQYLLVMPVLLVCRRSSISSLGYNLGVGSVCHQGSSRCSAKGHWRGRR